MVRIGVTGIAGRGGSFIGLLVSEAEDLSLAGALEATGHRTIGADAGLVVGAGALGPEISDDMEKAFADSDVIIDFTVPELTMQVARYASRTGKALVIGTTGISDGESTDLRSLSRNIPIVLSPNMSIGVNVMIKVVSELTSLLGDSYDVEIVEAHHRLKKDAPSGTALGWQGPSPVQRALTSTTMPAMRGTA